MPSESPLSSLADLPEAILWSRRTWTEFSRLQAPETHMVILPVFGFAGWGLGRPMDLEEILGCGVLCAMFDAAPDCAKRTIIAPPLRFALGPYPHCLFGIDYETALDLVREIAESIAAAG